MSPSAELHKRALKIVLGCDTFPPDINGAAKFTERLAAGLVRQGHEVHVFAPSTNKRFGSYREVHDGAQMVVHRLKSHAVPGHKTLRFSNPFGLSSKLERMISRIEPDAIHIQSHLLVGRYLAEVAIRNHIQLVATNHTMPENLIKYAFWIPRFFRAVAIRLSWLDAGRILTKANAVTTPTTTAASLLAENTSIDNAIPISCGIDTAEFASEGALVSEPPILLYVGRLDFEKRVQVLLEAFSKLPVEMGARLAIVGDGSEKESLEKWAEELGIRERVRFFGHVSDQELKRAYEGCTVFVMPSVAELQSIATMEAMASARPVVAANAAALPHLVFPGENGYLFDPDDTDDLAQKLEDMLSKSRQELVQMGQASLRRIQAHDIATTISRFEQLYRGELEVLPSLDNEDTYTQPINLTAADSSALTEYAARAARIRQGAKKLASGVLERLDEATGDVVERFEELRFDVTQRTRSASKKLNKSIRKALIRFRSGGR